MKYGKATNKSLGEIYNDMQGGILKLNPDFQRKLVWSKFHKENFLDTIIKGYPFPEIYYCNGETDLVQKKIKKLVVDGQQRLSTIYNYIEGTLALSFTKIPPYDQLTDDQKKDFLEYNIIIRDLEKVNDEEIKEIFKRINSVNYALNATEIRHALYDGEFISVAQKASDLFSKEIIIFREHQISRMKDTELILQSMVAIEMGGYFTGNNQVEELTKNYNDEYPNKEIMENNLKEFLELIHKINLNEDSIWFRRSNFFTLLVELIKYKLKRKTFPHVEKLRSMLIDFEKAVEENKTKDIEHNEYALYHHFTYQGTNSKNGRIIRGLLFRKHLELV